MHYFDVILLSDVIWAFGPKVTSGHIYVNFHTKNWSQVQLYLILNNPAQVKASPGVEGDGWLV